MSFRNFWLRDFPGLQITTRPLANASNFICGWQKLKNLLAHMVSRNFVWLFHNQTEVWLNIYFHFRFHFLLLIKHFLESHFSLDQSHTKLRAKIMLKFIQMIPRSKWFLFFLLLSPFHWKWGPQNIIVLYHRLE